MKPSKVVASPISGVYQPPLTVELDCPSVSVEPTSVATELGTGNTYESRNISKVDNSLFFNAQGNLELDGKLGIYNINTNTIANVSCPYNTVGASFIYVNGSVYIIGGFNPIGTVRHNKIMKYANGEVTILEAVLPQAVSYISCNVIGCYIYIIGGSNGTYLLSTIYRLDTTNDTIEEMDYSLKVGCADGSSVVYKNRYIYVIDGQPATNKVQIIDTEEGRVSLLSKDLPVSRYGSGAMIKDDFLYVFGGYSSGPKNTVYKKYLLDDSDWVLDTQTLVYPRSGFGSTSDEEGYYYVIGGSPSAIGRYYETGRFGLPSSDIEIRYTQTEDGTIPPDPTQADTLYTAPIKLTSPTKHNIKAKAFYNGE